MSDEEVSTTTPAGGAPEKVSVRDIYYAVNQSEKAIKEHITLLLLPLTAAVSDHEVRLRALERDGSPHAREAQAATLAVGLRVTALETLNTARAGGWNMLGNQKQLLLFLAVLVGLFLTALTIIDKVTP